MVVSSPVSKLLERSARIQYGSLQFVIVLQRKGCHELCRSLENKPVEADGIVEKSTMTDRVSALRISLSTFPLLTNF